MSLLLASIRSPHSLPEIPGNPPKFSSDRTNYWSCLANSLHALDNQLITDYIDNVFTIRISSPRRQSAQALVLLVDAPSSLSPQTSPGSASTSSHPIPVHATPSLLATAVGSMLAYSRHSTLSKDILIVVSSLPFSHSIPPLPSLVPPPPSWIPPQLPPLTHLLRSNDIVAALALCSPADRHCFNRVTLYPMSSLGTLPNLDLITSIMHAFRLPITVTEPTPLPLSLPLVDTPFSTSSHSTPSTPLVPSLSHSSPSLLSAWHERLTLSLASTFYLSVVNQIHVLFLCLSTQFLIWWQRLAQQLANSASITYALGLLRFSAYQALSPFLSPLPHTPLIDQGIDALTLVFLPPPTRTSSFASASSSIPPTCDPALSSRHLSHGLLMWFEMYNNVHERLHHSHWLYLLGDTISFLSTSRLVLALVLLLTPVSTRVIFYLATFSWSSIVQSFISFTYFAFLWLILGLIPRITTNFALWSMTTLSLWIVLLLFVLLCFTLLTHHHLTSSSHAYSLIWLWLVASISLFCLSFINFPLALCSSPLIYSLLLISFPSLRPSWIFNLFFRLPLLILLSPLTLSHLLSSLVLHLNPLAFHAEPCFQPMSPLFTSLLPHTNVSLVYSSLSLIIKRHGCLLMSAAPQIFSSYPLFILFAVYFPIYLSAFYNFLLWLKSCVQAPLITRVKSPSLPSPPSSGDIH